MKLTKRVMMVILSLALCLSFSGVGVLADDGIPDDLPEGTIKIAEGIYAYTPDVVTANDSTVINIGTVPAIGIIVQPGAFNNVVVEPSTRYLQVHCSESIRINFVRGTQSVFGSNVFDWPGVGGNINTNYYIEAAYYNIAEGVPYQVQCTSQTAKAKNNVQLWVYSWYNKDGATLE